MCFWSKTCTKVCTGEKEKARNRCDRKALLMVRSTGLEPVRKSTICETEQTFFEEYLNFYVYFSQKRKPIAK